MARFDSKEQSCPSWRNSISAHTDTLVSEATHTTSVSGCLNPATLTTRSQCVGPNVATTFVHELHSTSLGWDLHTKTIHRAVNVFTEFAEVAATITGVISEHLRFSIPSRSNR